jgi:DNA-binding NarL/FixJ family response regulator
VGVTLLIVDDHPGFRSFARALLEAEGYVVIGEAGNGASALDAVAALDPEVVLLDVALPDIDGFVVCDRLTARDARRPAIVLTSSRDASSFRQRLAASGARGFIPKSDLSAATLVALTG